MPNRAPRKKLQDEAIMTCIEVAEFLRVHLSSVRRWSRSGELKPESTEGGRRVSVLKRQEGAPVLLG